MKKLIIRGGKAAKFIITERVITIGTRVFTDVPMFYFIVSDPKYGWIKSMIWITPVYIFFCALVVYVSDKFNDKGIDITGIEEMRSIALSSEISKKNIIKRFIRWFMSRKSLIFIFGSIFYLDPDYVTLMIRDRNDSFLKVMLKITIPSVLISMLWWNTIYWLAYQPVKGMAVRLQEQE